ncbi:MAG TPA: PadR family transcriptional regulator [Steroidobacteraceae bacterium]|jgi:DNA-binding PadR family transcriptional regulator|nr:PadR family transcriptional regulator [Steroidobacteraceae bacterium]
MNSRFRAECAYGREFGRFGHRQRFFGALRQGYFGGLGLRAGKMLSADDLQLIMLALLQDGPRHGYDIIKSLQEHSSGLYKPSPGVVYPALTYLEEAGLAVSETEGSKRRYRITEAGSELLAKQRATADELLAQLARFGQKMAQFQREYHEDEVAGQEWGGSGSGTDGGREQDKHEWRQVKAQFHELRHEFKQVLFEKLHASIEEKRRVLEILRRAIAEIRGK